MTDQDYIHLKQQQKKRSNKLKERNRNWYMEELYRNFKMFVIGYCEVNKGVVR